MNISEQRSRNMRAIRSSGTKIEVLLGKALWATGLRYRKNCKTIFGKPDIVFRKYRLVIFCDSEFWHGKNWEREKQKIHTRREFWIPKIEGNIRRDKQVNKILKKDGWKVLRFWGNDIEKKTDRCVKKVLQTIEKQTLILKNAK